MSIRKDLVIKISNGSASLDMPLQIYEKDHGIELRFKLMDYKYKYDKDPDNILNSNKEDILEAYTTIVNPLGYELAQINGEVVDDTVKFMIEDSYTDELEEIGIYQLQIHVKCKHSEFSIPPVQFNVLERLKGEKVVTDGDDEVDNSDIIDGNTKFIDDETGKLIIQWQKGDTISSVRLNAMVEVINNAVDEEAQRQLNEVEREQQELEREQQELEREQQELEREQQELERENRLQAALNSVDARVDESMDEYETRFNALTASQELEREQLELERENRLQTALNSVDARVDESMDEYETRFNALTASQQQDMEVIDARDGEVSLKARLDRDVRNPLQMYEDVEGSYISCDSIDGYAKDVAIKGNTVQDASNLADIRSVGDKVEGQELYKIDVVSCGKNLLDNTKFTEGISINAPNGLTSSYANYGISDFIRVYEGNTYTISKDIRSVQYVYFYKDAVLSTENYLGISNRIEVTNNVVPTQFNVPSGAKYCVIASTNETRNIQLEEGTVATPYEPYKEEKLTILSPVQLEKVGVVADRIICKDGVWGVEKNIGTVYYKDLVNLKETTVKKDNFLFVQGEHPNLTLNNYNIDGNTVLCSKKFLHSFDESEHMWYDSATTTFRFAISKEITSVFDSSKIIEYYTIENVFMKIQLTQPTFIPLPYDQQVKLCTFAGQTNIHFETEIEGTIKAQVPKSIGATVNTHTEQIGNLSKELDRVKKLEKSTVSTVTTESNFTTVEETSNGYFEDVKLDGRTLVNKFVKKAKFPSSVTVNGNEFVTNLSAIQTITDLLRFNSNKITFMYEIKGNDTETVTDFAKYFRITKNGGSTIGGFRGELTTSYRQVVQVVDVDEESEYLVELRNPCSVKNIIILEGDHTQNPPSFFEGLKSVGDGVEEISVLTQNKEETKQDKKRILYYNDETQTWEKPVLRQWDSIEKHSDGKYYYHKRSGEVVLNGTESWSKAYTQAGDYNQMYISKHDMIRVNDYTGRILCDKLEVLSDDEIQKAGITGYTHLRDYPGENWIYINTAKSTAELKEWLAANNVTVAYQATQEEIYECINVDLITYNGETNYIVNTGVITPKSTLKVMSNIGNVVRELQQKVSNLENYIQHVMLDALNNALNE